MRGMAFSSTGICVLSFKGRYGDCRDSCDSLVRTAEKENPPAGTRTDASYAFRVISSRPLAEEPLSISFETAALILSSHPHPSRRPLRGLLRMRVTVEGRGPPQDEA